MRPDSLRPLGLKLRGAGRLWSWPGISQPRLAQGLRRLGLAALTMLLALAGPAFGLLAMIPLVGLWMATGEAEWMIGAFLVAMINLINLAPAPPLDGSKALGPVLARVDPMVEKAALIAIGALVVWWGVTTGRFILAVFLGIALLGHLRAGAWRPPGGKLTWPQAGQSLGLFLATGLACAAAGIGVLLPLADGSLPGAIDFGARFIGIER